MSRYLAVMGLAVTLFLVSLFGCAGVTREAQLGDALAIGGATLKCAAGEAPLVQQAIAGGGNDWLGEVMVALGCVPGVVESIVHASRSPQAQADVGGLPLPPVYSKRALKRARVALAMYQLVRPNQ